MRIEHPRAGLTERKPDGELAESPLDRMGDLDPAFARKFLNFVISEVIRHHEQLQK